MPIDWGISDNQTIIPALLLSLIFALIIILHLKKTLGDERKRREVPLLMLDLAPYGRGLLVCNIGKCCARDVQLQEMTYLFDYDFKKEFSFQFHPIDFIAPGEERLIEGRIFDGEYEIFSEARDVIWGYLGRASWEMTLRFTNMEGVRFQSCIEKRQNKIFIKNQLKIKK